MRTIPILCLAATLWLAGCASTAPDSTSPEQTPATATRTAAGEHKAVQPTGAMQPLAAARAGSQAVAHLEPPADLWERIRRGFAMPNLESDLVRDREQWYATRPDYMLRMTERSRKYLFHIVEELERRNMPTELALLPFIESAFNPQAVSSAKAAGMWQFMPATGKYFELKQNVFRDDRRDVLESTRAALDYLQKLYGMFGDWHLALAAYNWGEGSVGRALSKNQRAGLGLSYPELNMPMETRFYVPKLQAVKNIIAQPEAFNAKLPLIENHPYFQTVDITRDIDVALAARLAEIKLEDFKALNPSLHRPVILAAGTPQILLPWDNAAIFQRNLEAHSSHRLASWTAWVAPTTMKAAEAARRVGMDEDELRSINNIPPRMMIKAGSTLLVPRSDRADADVAEHVADNGQLAFTPEVVLRRTVVRARRGESLAALAGRYGVSAASVAGWNKLGASAALKKGQTLVMYLPAPAGRAAARSRVAGKPAAAAPSAAKPARRSAGVPTRKTRR
ncbi:transglycosylase SLT domain-containing protein [Ramlibacter sp. 2FC]|uniref:transglycosylase SLT domain-containing protein n=1 Tax=Ramlibacter sp. 2FC TaxID=2502188 RepID=UPI0010F85B60|nr:transglycosylase SLT domain-containing protein [Ramlibacter sp. 2FC]